MVNNNEMPKVVFDNDSKLKTSHMYAKYIEEKNQQRAYFAKKVQTKNRYLVTGLSAFVLSVYLFTIYKVKQENFLDDFEEPPRVIKQK